MSEFETTSGGIWRIAGCRDWYSQYEHPWHISLTANQHDAITVIELALADYEPMFGHPLVDTCPVNEDTGELLPVVTIVTDKGGPFRSLNFELFIMGHPDLRHVRTRVRAPRKNGSRGRGFGTLKYERLFPGDIPDALTLVERAEDYRIEYKHRAPSRNHHLEPAPRSPPQPHQRDHPHPQTRRNPANYLTRDTSRTALERPKPMWSTRTLTPCFRP